MHEKSVTTLLKTEHKCTPTYILLIREPTHPIQECIPITEYGIKNRFVQYYKYKEKIISSYYKTTTSAKSRSESYQTSTCKYRL